MTDIEILKAPVKDEYFHYKNYYKTALKSNIKILDYISGFIHSRKENEIIPLLTLLTAKATGKITDQTYTAASVIDLLSTATIIHNEVADEDITKYDFFKVKTLWKSKLAVLMGDYFLAKGLLLSVKNKTYSTLEIISKSVKEITEGELSNIYYSRKLMLTRNEYYEVIVKKSGSLMSACTTIGALSSEASEKDIVAMKNFGNYFGIIYHIKNDLSSSSRNKSGTFLSYPLIIAIENANDTDKNELSKLLNKPSREINTKYLNSFIKSNGGIEGSKQILLEYINLAHAELSSLQNSKSKEALLSLLNA